MQERIWTSYLDSLNHKSEGIVVLVVVGHEQVLHEIHLHPMAFSNGYGWEQVQKPVQNVR